MTARGAQVKPSDLFPSNLLGRVESHLANGWPCERICAEESVPARYVALVSVRLEAINIDDNERVKRLELQMRACLRGHPVNR